MLLCPLQVLSLALDLVELVVVELEDGNGRPTNKVRVCVVPNHEGPMVDDCPPTQSLNHKILILSTPVVFERDFNDAILDQK